MKRSLFHCALGLSAFAVGLGLCYVLGILWRFLLTALDPAHPPRAHIVGDTLLGLACSAMVVMIVALTGWAARGVGREIEFRYDVWKSNR